MSVILNHIIIIISSGADDGGCSGLTHLSKLSAKWKMFKYVFSQTTDEFKLNAATLRLFGLILLFLHHGLVRLPVKNTRWSRSARSIDVGLILIISWVVWHQACQTDCNKAFQWEAYRALWQNTFTSSSALHLTHDRLERKRHIFRWHFQNNPDCLSLSRRERRLFAEAWEQKVCVERGVRGELEQLKCGC